MKLLKISLVTAVVLGMGSSVSADALSDAFKDAKVSGEIRSMYIKKNSDATGADADGSAIGGNLGYETGDFYGFKAKVALYTTNKLTGSDSSGSSEPSKLSNTALLDGADGYTILGEAYLQYTYENTVFKAGRQRLDSPLAGADDSRIIPNLFEAYLVMNTDLPDTTLIAVHATKMSGWDSVGDITKFESTSKAAGASYNKGTTVFGAINSSIKDLTLQAWYYRAHDVADGIYVDGAYSLKTDDIAFNFAAQYWNIESQNELDDDFSFAGQAVDYDVYGLKADVTFANLTALVAYNDMTLNSSSATGVHGAWGGYPEYAYANEMFLNSYNDNGADVTKLSLSYDAGFATFETAYIVFDGHNDLNRATVATADANVIDIIASWDCKLVDNLSIFALYENQNMDDTSGASSTDSDIVKLSLAYKF